MAEPIVFISRWRIREGKRAELEAMYARAVLFIGSGKPNNALLPHTWTNPARSCGSSTLSRMRER